MRFSNYLLSLSTVMGFVVAGGSSPFAVLYGLLWCFGFPFPMGNPTIVILILFMGGSSSSSIGILGEDVGRIYEEVKDRPKFIVARAEGFAGAPVGRRPRAGPASASSRRARGARMNAASAEDLSYKHADYTFREF